MATNFTLINLGIGGNRLELTQIRAIDEALVRNKNLYDAERYREWGERKMMKKEQERSEMANTLAEQLNMKSKNIKAREYTA
jgi:hypothetical protein